MVWTLLTCKILCQKFCRQCACANMSTTSVHNSAHIDRYLHLNHSFKVLGLDYQCFSSGLLSTKSALKQREMKIAAAEWIFCNFASLLLSYNLQIYFAWLKTFYTLRADAFLFLHPGISRQKILQNCSCKCFVYFQPIFQITSSWNIHFRVSVLRLWTVLVVCTHSSGQSVCEHMLGDPGTKCQHTGHISMVATHWSGAGARQGLFPILLCARDLQVAAFSFIRFFLSLYFCVVCMKCCIGNCLNQTWLTNESVRTEFCETGGQGQAISYFDLWCCYAIQWFYDTWHEVKKSALFSKTVC